MDKLTNYIRYWQAAGESERISERTRTRIRQLTSEGVFTGGVCPYGYQLVRQGRINKKGQPLYDLVIHPDEAEVIRYIFEKAALEGYGAYRLTNFLNENKIYPKSGKPWNAASIYGILRNPLYTGVLHKGGESSYQEHLQIISCNLFQEAQELRQSPSNQKAAMRTTPSMRGTALLSGFLYCGTCGSRMSSNHIVRHKQKANGSTTICRTQRYYCCKRKDGLPCKCGGQHTYITEKVNDRCLEQLDEFIAPLFARSPDEIAAERGVILKTGVEEKSSFLKASFRQLLMKSVYYSLRSWPVCVEHQASLTPRSARCFPALRIGGAN